MSYSAAVFVFEGVEDSECVCCIDFLRRANVTVTVVSLSEACHVRTAHGINIIADTTIREIGADAIYDVLCLPGGSGTFTNIELLSQRNPAMLRLQSMFQAQAQAKRLCAAICAAPILLAQFGILEDATVCCYPGCEEQVMAVEKKPKTVNTATDAMNYGNYIITSRGPATALIWAHSIVRVLAGAEIAEKVGSEMLLRLA